MSNKPSGPGYRMSNKNDKGGRTPLAEAKTLDGLLVYATEENPLPIALSLDLENYLQNSSEEFISKTGKLLKENLPDFSKDLFPSIKSISEELKNFKLDELGDYSIYLLYLEEINDKLFFLNDLLKNNDKNTTSELVEDSEVETITHFDGTKQDNTYNFPENNLETTILLDIKKILEDIKSSTGNSIPQKAILQNLFGNVEKETKALENLETSLEKSKENKIKNLFKTFNLTDFYKGVSDFKKQKDLPEKKKKLEERKNQAEKKLEEYIKEIKDAKYPGITIPELKDVLNETFSNFFDKKDYTINDNLNNGLTEKVNEKNIQNEIPNIQELPELNNTSDFNNNNNYSIDEKDTLNGISNIQEPSEINNNYSIDERINPSLNFNIKTETIQSGVETALNNILPEFFKKDDKKNSSLNYMGNPESDIDSETIVYKLFDDNTSKELVEKQTSSDITLKSIDNFQKEISEKLQKTNDLLLDFIEIQSSQRKNSLSKITKRLF